MVPIPRGIEIVKSLINQAKDNSPGSLDSLYGLNQRAIMIITKLFGEKSNYLVALKSIHFTPGWSSATPSEHRDYWISGHARFENLMTTILEELKIDQDALDTVAPKQTDGMKSNKVFIVHGHDVEMKEAVARILEKLELQPVILHEQPNKGRTIIEKFTAHADVGYAVVLLSPDDLGCSSSEYPAEIKCRARQNVILELGFFLGKLGRSNVLPLYKKEDGKDFELPSDYDGVIYTEYDQSEAWHGKLVKELKASGYRVDANKVL